MRELIVILQMGLIITALVVAVGCHLLCAGVGLADGGIVLPDHREATSPH